MIFLTTVQSWAILILLAAFVIAMMVLLREMGQRRIERERQAQNAADERLAIVTKLRPAKAERHLALVPELPRLAPKEPYDWKKQGY